MLHRNHKVELLKKAPLFAGCSKRELEQIAMVADELDFQPGKALTRKGRRAASSSFSLDGTVEVSREGRKIDTAGSGDFFGEMALLTDQPRNATVTTTIQASTCSSSMHELSRACSSTIR